MGVRNCAAALAALAALAGCAADGGATRVSSTERIQSGDVPMVRGGGGGARTPLMVQGATAEQTAAIAAAMTMPARLGGGGFRPAQPGEGGSRLAVGQSGAGPRGLCSGGGGAPSGGRADQATLAWCWNADLLASTVVASPALAGGDPAAFARAVESGLEVMLTPERTHSRR